jgi:hypothetical protein
MMTLAAALFIQNLPISVRDGVDCFWCGDGKDGRHPIDCPWGISARTLATAAHSFQDTTQDMGDFKAMLKRIKE